MKKVLYLLPLVLSSQISTLPLECLKDLEKHNFATLAPQTTNLQALPQPEPTQASKVLYTLGKFKKIEASEILNPEDKDKVDRKGILASGLFSTLGLWGLSFLKSDDALSRSEGLMLGVFCLSLGCLEGIDSFHYYERLSNQINQHEEDTAELVNKLKIMAFNINGQEKTIPQNFLPNLRKINLSERIELIDEAKEIQSHELCRTKCQEHYKARLAFLAELNKNLQNQ